MGNVSVCVSSVGFSVISWCVDSSRKWLFGFIVYMMLLYCGLLVLFRFMVMVLWWLVSRVLMLVDVGVLLLVNIGCIWLCCYCYVLLVLMCSSVV